jgi:hypothetical protein
VAIIDSLRTEFQPIARAIEAACDKEAAEHGLRAKIIQGYRSFEQQAAKYAQGRTAPGDRVTNARPGYSWHNYGLAIDIGVFTMSGAYLGNHALYEVFDDIVKRWNIPGLVVGTSFGDDPHYEWHPGPYGASVSPLVAQRYGRNPFSLPLSIATTTPALPPKPMAYAPTEFEQSCFQDMIGIGVYKAPSGTDTGTPKTKERYELAVILKRLFQHGDTRWTRLDGSNAAAVR